MKPLKYTVAALAILAAASFTTSAQADTANAGDVVFGLYDTTGVVTNSYELDLGSFSTLTSGETWNLGTTVATAYSADSNPNLVFNIAASGQGNGAGGLGSTAKAIAFTLNTLPSTIASSLTTPNTAINAIQANYGVGTDIALPSSTSSTGTGITAISIANSQTGSFNNEFVHTALYGLDTAASSSSFASSFSNGTSASFYTYAGGGLANLVADGSFSLSNVGGNEILTYNLAATPEPSAYALGLCAVALFWVLKRRRSVA